MAHFFNMSKWKVAGTVAHMLIISVYEADIELSVNHFIFLYDGGRRQM